MKKTLITACILIVIAATFGQQVHNSNGGGTAVSGTVNANQGAPAMNTSAWPVKITDGGSNTAGWFANNLQVLTGGTDPQNGNTYTTLRISGFGDASTTSWASALTSAELMAYNGNSGFDRLRSTSADGSAKTGVLEVSPVASYIYINSATTTVVKSTAGVLHKVILNTKPGNQNTLGLYDVAGSGCSGAPGSGLFATLTFSTALQPETFTYDVAFKNGFCVVTSQAGDITITFE